MNDFIITTDSSCDFSLNELKEMNVFPLPFKYNNGISFKEDTMEEKDYKEFYQKMRDGVVWKTSQINPQEYYDFFKKLYDKYHLPILHISLGSGVSNTVNSLAIAINLLEEEGIIVKGIDSKIASLGVGLIVCSACDLKNKGKSFEETYEELLKLIPNVNTFYTTNTLTYFARGGRLSKVEAFLGNALRVNPILDVNPSGNLRVIDKCHGSNKTLKRLIARIKSTVIDPQDQTLFITHADNLERAKEVAIILVNECGFKNYRLTFMGPIIGAHAGPGLIAVFFKGKERKESPNYYIQKYEALENMNIKNS